MKTQTQNALKEFAPEIACELAKMLSSLNVKEVKGEGTFEVVASTEGADRDGEKILIKGWELDNYRKNPVVLFGHDYWSLPIGAVTELIEDGDKLIAKGVFARTEVAQTARQLYDDGFLKAVSVGFIVKERNQNIITKAELLELSFVPVPANADALTLEKIGKFEEMLKTVPAKKEDEPAGDGAGDPNPQGDDGDDAADEDTPLIIMASLKDDLVALFDGAMARMEEMAKGEPKTAKGAGAKAGRTLSSKTRATINEATEAMATASKALKELLETADADTEKAKTEHVRFLQGFQKNLETALKSAKNL